MYHFHNFTFLHGTSFYIKPRNKEIVIPSILSDHGCRAQSAVAAAGADGSFFWYLALSRAREDPPDELRLRVECV